MVTSNGTMTVTGVGLVTHTGDDFEEPFSMPCTLHTLGFKTGAAIHILMLVGNLGQRTIVKCDPRSMTQEKLTGSVEGVRARFRRRSAWNSDMRM